MATSNTLAELYVSVLNRAPDSAGLAFWQNILDTGKMTLSQIGANWMTTQAEVRALYPTTQTTDAFISAIYSNVLGRTADTAGAVFWKAALDSGQISRDSFVSAIIDGAKAPTGSSVDAAYLGNRAQVGEYFAERGINGGELAAKILTAVTADTNSVKAAEAIVRMIPANGTGLTTAMTTSLSNIIADVKATPATTLTNLVTYLEAVAQNLTTANPSTLASVLTAVDTVTTSAASGNTLNNPSTLASSTVSNPSSVTASSSTSSGGSSTAVTITELAASWNTSRLEGIHNAVVSDAATKALLETLDAATMGTVRAATVTDTAANLTAWAGASTYSTTTTNVTALHSTLAANLSTITSTTVTAAFDGNGTFTGNLGTAVTTVATGVTLSAAAAVVSGKTINKAGTGAVAVDASVDAAVTLKGSANFTVTGLVNALTATDVTGTLAVTVAADAAVSIATGSGTNTINADNLTDTQVLTLTGDDAASISLVGGDLSAGTGTGAYTVTATTGSNVITTGSGNDTINSGAGIDTITGGAGIDTIVLTDADNAVDSVILGALAANADIITGFVTAEDLFKYLGGDLTAGTGAGTNTVSAATMALSIGADNASFGFIVTDAVANAVANTQGDAFTAFLASNATNAAANYATLEAQLVAADGALAGTIAGLDTAVTNGQNALIILDNGTGSIVLKYTADTSTANVIVAADLQLIGVLTNTAQLAAGDIAYS